MKVLVLNTEDGSSAQCLEEEISQEHLEGVDHATLDIIRWDAGRQSYQRAAVEIKGDVYEVAQWNDL